VTLIDYRQRRLGALLFGVGVLCLIVSLLLGWQEARIEITRMMYWEESPLQLLRSEIIFCFFVIVVMPPFNFLNIARVFCILRGRHIWRNAERLILP
jgi:hypothetical protein